MQILFVMCQMYLWMKLKSFQQVTQTGWCSLGELHRAKYKILSMSVLFLWPSPFFTCCHGWYSVGGYCHLSLTITQGFQPKTLGRALKRILPFWDSIPTSCAIHLHLKLNRIPLIITSRSKSVSHMWKECCNPSPSFCLDCQRVITDGIELIRMILPLLQQQSIL